MKEIPVMFCNRCKWYCRKISETRCPKCGYLLRKKILYEREHDDKDTNR